MRLINLLLLLLPTLSISQRPDNLIPRELLFRDKDKVAVSLSTEGQLVLYQKDGSGADSTIYYLDVVHPLVERDLKFHGAVQSFTPLYKQGLLAVIRTGAGQQLEYYSFATRSSRVLNGRSSRRISIVKTSARFPNKVMVRTSDNEWFLVDVLSDRWRRQSVPADFSSVFFDEAFGQVAADRPNSLGGNTLLRKTAGGWDTLFIHSFIPEYFVGGFSRIVSVSNDGATIYATSNQDRDKTALFAIDAASGETHLLAEDPDADILPYAASVDARGKVTSVVALWADTRRHVVDASCQAGFDFLRQKLGNGVGFVATSEDDNYWLVRQFDGGPSDYYHFDRRQKKLLHLFNDYSHLDGFDLATRKAFTVETRDGLKLPVHVYVPPGMAGDNGLPKVPLPTIIYIHGGPWAGVTHWNSWFHNRNFQLLANRHYVVINMEFRGTTGLGKAFCDAGNKQWGDAMHHDILDVVNWAIDKGIAHKDRIGMWGWSYGGYATNYALAKAPEKFACGVSMYGIADLESFCRLPFADNDFWRQRVGDVNNENDLLLLRSHSPVNHVSSIEDPILLTTGSLDERVPQQQYDDFAKALHDAGKEVIYFYYPKEVHDYRQPESWISFWAVAEHFLHLYLRGRKEGIGEALRHDNFKVVYGEDFIKGIW